MIYLRGIFQNHTSRWCFHIGMISQTTLGLSLGWFLKTSSRSSFTLEGSFIKTPSRGCFVLRGIGVTNHILGVVLLCRIVSESHTVGSSFTLEFGFTLGNIFMKPLGLFQIPPPMIGISYRVHPKQPFRQHKYLGLSLGYPLLPYAQHILA